MIRRSIIRAFLILLVTAALAVEVSAVQVNVANRGYAPTGTQQTTDAAALRLARSILDPVPAQPSAQQAPATQTTDTSSFAASLGPKSISASSGQNPFAQLDAIVAAHLPATDEETTGQSAHAQTAEYQAAVKRSYDRQVGQVSALLPAERSADSLSAEAAETAIVIHPPVTKPMTPNHHFFQIENTSQQDAVNVAVELAVPSHNHIVEVAPYDTTVVGKTARYKFNSIPAGESRTIELTTSPVFKDEVVFESRFSMEHVRHLAARSVPHKINVWSPEKKSDRTPVAKTEPVKREKKNVPARKVAAKPDMNILSGKSARSKWEQNARLNYGQAGIPAKVMVANSQVNQLDQPELEQPQVDQFQLSQTEPVSNPAVAANVPVTQQDESVLEASRSFGEKLVEAKPEIASDDLSPAATVASASADNGWFQSQLKTKIDGPQHAVTGEEAEYQVLVENGSQEDVDDVLVQLAIPTGLEVTVLDRDAWFDGKARTITWKLPKVSAGSKETIRYLAKVVSSDGQLQKVTLGAANQFRGQAIFQSTVMDQYELAAPLLPFEKDAASLK